MVLIRALPETGKVSRAEQAAVPSDWLCALSPSGPNGGGRSYGSSSRIVGCGGGLPPLLIFFHRLPVSTSFVLAALRALHVDTCGAVEVRAGTEEMVGCEVAAGGWSTRPAR
jgi:hypothetical protein